MDPLEQAMAKMAEVFARDAFTLADRLNLEGQNGLVHKKFVGFDRDYSRLMIYRIDGLSQFSGKIPLLNISELTVHPMARTCGYISLANHTKDNEVTGLNLAEIAAKLGLPTDQFHHYV